MALKEHLGDSFAATDSSGAQAASTSYLPYGGARSNTGTLPTDKKFTGQRLDGTGLYYYGARYYDAEIGRFVSADPIAISAGNVADLNRYAYGRNNPSKYTDPSGLDVMLIHGTDTTREKDPEWDTMIKGLRGKGIIGEDEPIYYFDWENGNGYGVDVAHSVESLQAQMAPLKDIKIFGFSKGGALAMEYLAQGVEGTIQINTELKSVVTLNAPLEGILSTGLGGFERYGPPDQGGADRLANLPDTVKIITVVDTANIVGHGEIPGVTNISYSSSWWVYGHIYVPFTDLGITDVHGNVQQYPWQWVPLLLR